MNPKTRIKRARDTADGAFALLSNTTGNDNTANGASALLSNTEGDGNTATGSGARDGQPRRT
jgi:hypothetical protein